MIETNTHQNEIDNIVNALYLKSKRAFSRKLAKLKKQALYFSPFYREFIYKIIKNKSLLINDTYRGGSTYSNSNDSNKLQGKQKSYISVDIDEVDILPHELGHAVDFWFESNNALTSHVILSNGNTLEEIFVEEFNSNQGKIYELVMNEYKEIINSNINDKAYDLLMINMPIYQMLLNIKVNLDDKKITSKRRRLQSTLYESGFVDTYYLLYERKCFSVLNNKYSPILDALSSRYDFSGLLLDHHEYDYYALSKGHEAREFFANVFEAKVTSKHVQFDNLIKLLPRSFNAFEELFDIFYSHIMNNKRFTDVRFRKDSDNNGL